MEIPSKAAKTQGLKGILYFKTVKDGIINFSIYLTLYFEFSLNYLKQKRPEAILKVFLPTVKP